MRFYRTLVIALLQYRKYKDSDRLILCNYNSLHQGLIGGKAIDLSLV